MFDHTSRYDKLDKLQIEEDGRRITYVARRFRPSPAEMATLAEVRLSEGVRLDQLAAAMLGQSELFWRICDANDELNPFDLTECLERVLKVPMPGRQEL